MALQKLALANPLLPAGSKLNPIDGIQGSNAVVELVQKFISIGFVLASLLFVFWFIGGGIKWITSGGDKNKHEEARGAVTNAVIGLFVLFALYMVLRFLERFFGINLLQIDLNKLKIR